MSKLTLLSLIFLNPKTIFCTFFSSSRRPIYMMIINESFHYLDPGTGSYLYQALIAAGVTVGIYFKNLRFFMVSLLEKIKKNSEK